MSGEERSFHTHADLSLSRLLATVFEVEPGHCFRNAWRCFILSPELFRPHGTFVEGWYVLETKDEIILTEHGWIEQEGRIIDPSVVVVAEPETPVFYFPGVRRTWEETEALEGEMFPQVRFDGKHGEDGLDHPSYKAAREAAVRKVYALAQAHTPPKTMHFWVSRDIADIKPLGKARSNPASFEVHGNCPLDLTQSREVAANMQVQPGQCWHNAREAMLHQFPSRFFLARYVEGWLVGEFADAIRVVEHGWIETSSGTVIDPTLVAEEPPQSVEYLPGDTLTWQELQAYTGASFPRARYAPRYSLSYQNACQQALTQAEKLAWKTGRPVRCCPGEMTIFSLAGGLTQTCWDFPVPSEPSARILQFLELIKGSTEL